MRDEDKTKEQLLSEIQELRARISELARTEDERLSAIEDLRSSEERFRLLAANLPGTIYLRKNGQSRAMVYISANVEALTGYPQSDFMDQRIGLADLLHPDDSAGVSADVADAIREQRPFHLLYRIKKLDGAVAWIEEWGTALYENGEVALIEGFLADVTSVRHAETALRRTEGMYGALFRHSNDGIVVHTAQGKVLDVNQKMLSMIGMTREQMHGTNIKAVMSPESLERVQESMTQLFWTGEVTLEMELVRPDGGKFPVETSSSIVDVGGEKLMLNIVRDITDRKRAEDELREENDFREALIQGAGIGIAVCHEIDGPPYLHFTVWNPMMEEMTGVDAGEINAVSWLETFFPDPGEAGRLLKDYQARRKVDEIVPYEGSFTARDGTRRNFELTTSGIMGADGKKHWLVILRDRTQRVKDEAERRKLQFQVQQAQKMESLGILAGGIAHDFNNLLMGILGNADLALRDIPPLSPARECIADIEKASRRAADLCRQMLAYSGKGRFVVEALDLSEAVREMANLLEASIQKKVTVNFQLASNLPMIRADATQVRQVIMNLITNAAEAVGEARGSISVCTGRIRCDKEYFDSTYMSENLPGGDYVFLEVNDTGCGMDQETLKRIFDPFFSTKFTGRGLGLSAVLGIVRGHGGAMKIYSEPGKGSTFKALFPASADASPGRTQGPAGPPLDVRMQGKVLLADDEDTIRIVTGRMLEKMGFSVVLASDGEEALRAFSSDPHGVSLVILDMTMPRMDGEECFRELRRVRKDVRVILSSGYNEQEVTQRFAGKGLAGFIQKPYVLDNLVAKVMEAMAR